MKRILITGCNGYVSRNLIRLLPQYDFLTTNRQDLDLLNTDAVDSLFKNNFFDLVINSAISGGSRLEDDNYLVLLNNILMHNNLMRNRKYFSKFINFGSGAELNRDDHIDEKSILEKTYPKDFYGMSKNIIAKTEINNPNFYNVRIFNVFNYDEIATRMIKANIINYINKKPIIIHQNKYMDFFYMDDLAEIIKHLIENNETQNTINCSYEKKFCLLQIANMINNLDNYNVEIQLNEASYMGKSYYGKYNLPNSLSFIGFEEGLKRTYKIVKES